MHIVLYCSVLYGIVLYCIVLYCIRIDSAFVGTPGQRFTNVRIFTDVFLLVNLRTHFLRNSLVRFTKACVRKRQKRRTYEFVNTLYG